MEAVMEKSQPSKAELAMEMIKHNPDMKAADVAKAIGTTKQYVYDLRSRKLNRPTKVGSGRGPGRPRKVETPVINTIKPAINVTKIVEVNPLKATVEQLRLELEIKEQIITFLKEKMRGASV
jgi:transposase